MASVAGARPMQSTPSIQAIGAKSSFIAALEYDQQNLTLTTHMKNGAIYQHKYVTPLDWNALQQSQDHSSHWSKNIRGKKMSVRVKVAKAPRSELKHGRK
jgi:hypothetical protein